MGMFDTYDDLGKNYIQPSEPKRPLNKNKLQPLVMKKPYEEYNAEGELIGYYWYYGDTVELDFHITGEITIESDSIIYCGANECPTIDTEGVIDQKAINIVDFISWTLTAITEDLEYVWTQDEIFTEPTDGDIPMYISAQSFLKDKQISVRLFNFRGEELDIKTYAGSADIKYTIDKELSDTLLPSVYKCTVTIWSDEGLSKEILSKQDCVLTVK